MIAFVTAVQLRTPLAIQGRVTAAADLSIGLPQTLSIAVGAGLSTVVDYRILVLVMGLVVAAPALWLVRRPPAVEAAAEVV